MKKLILAIALITGLSTLANAQEKASKPPAQKAEHKTQTLQKKLNLNAAQTKQVNAIFLTEATRLDSLKANKAGKKANKTVHKAIEAQTDQKLNAVFTADQKKTYAGIISEKKQKHAKKSADATPKQ